MPAFPIRIPARTTGLFLLALLSAPVVAEPRHEAPAPPPTAPAADEDAPGVTVFAATRERSTPFGSRVREAEAVHRLELAGARARLAGATPRERAAIQREIETLKRTHAARLTGLQIERARAAGREAIAARLEQRLARLEAQGARIAPATEGGAR